MSEGLLCEPPAGSAAERRVVALPAGELELTVERCCGELDSLIGFAARNNPRRAFLFLSKVLGKHYPSCPDAMQAVHKQLAGEVPPANGTVVFVGMAETATGLGQGVFEAWLRQNPGAPALYLQTTRYRIQGAACLTFEESHSHAPRIFLHLPAGAFERAMLANARQVVLIDDELSTGNTFVNLVRVLRGAMPALGAVHLATICDFIGAGRGTALAGEMALPCSFGALVTGHWTFTPNKEPVVSSGAAQCPPGHEVTLTDSGYGRLGRTTPVQVPEALVTALANEPVSGPTLVLGTGEFMHAAFVLGSALQARDIDVRVQSTTRSPILVGADVKRMFRFSDPYGEGVHNYLYNVGYRQYTRVLICHEMPVNSTLRSIAALLSGRLIHFMANDDAEEIHSVR